MNFFAFFSFAQNFINQFDFSFEIKNGFTHEKFGEYLFSSADSSKKVSYLEWESDALYSLGIDGNLCWKNFFVTGGFEALFPTFGAYMTDSDWAGDLQTNYAEFTNSAQKNYSWNAGLSYCIALERGVFFAPLVFYEHRYDSFLGTNGYGYYGNSAYSKTGENVAWNSENARYAKCSDISYERQSDCVFAGFSLGAKFSQIKFAASFFASPFSCIKTRDYHSDLSGSGLDYTMYAYFTDLFSILGTKAKFEWNCTSFAALNLNLDFYYSPLLKGKLFSNYWYKRTSASYGVLSDSSEYSLLNQKSGTKLFIFQLTLGFKMTF